MPDADKLDKFHLHPYYYPAHIIHICTDSAGMHGIHNTCECMLQIHKTYTPKLRFVYNLLVGCMDAASDRDSTKTRRRRN